MSRGSFPRSNVKREREREGTKDQKRPCANFNEDFGRSRDTRWPRFALHARGKKIEKTRTSENTRLSSANVELTARDVFFSLFFFLFSFSRHFAEGVVHVPPPLYPRALQMLSIIIISILGRRVGRVVAADVPLVPRAEKPPSRGRSSSECYARRRPMGK